MINKIIKKCEKIKILLTDVDGVLTDGGMYYSAQGDVMKKFHARDGMGVNMLRRNNISTIIVTKEKSQIVKRWAKKMLAQCVNTERASNKFPPSERSDFVCQ